MADCPNCNGHGFLVKRERHALAVDHESGRLVSVEVDGVYEAPTDKEADQDCVDLDPRPCRKCGGWGIVRRKKPRTGVKA